MKTHYDADADALYIRLSPVPISETEEVAPGVMLDFDAAGHLIGIEVLGASRRLPEGTDLPSAAE
ncbi:MAG: DUF2283 domain-containing protein [Bauldia sp.]|nr:DUF2283 domain-containing protein [Bauldia sp.]